ncbi:Uncharacterized protein At1g51745 [Linum grandiflorum]
MFLLCCRDWYNLEKSKRVKPFRCGDFDECIEKAESAHGIPIKKREKYARREDAILHAIELERKLLASKALDDDHSGEMPRMRDLKDFGLKTAIRKRKLSLSVDFDSRRSSPENQRPGNSADNSNGVEQRGTFFCDKQSDLLYLPAECGDLMDDKDLPSGQVKMLAIDMYPTKFDENGGHPHQGSLNERNSSSDYMQDMRHNSSESDSSESDSSATEPKMKNGSAMFSDCLEPRGELETTSSEETDDSAFSGRTHPHYPEDSYRANEAESIWQWRGKQDSSGHHVIRKPLERAKEKFSHPYRTTATTVRSYHGDSDDDDDDDDDDDNEFESRQFRSQKSRQSTIGLNKTRWEDITWEDRPAFRGCFKVRGQHFTRTGFMLVDVDLKVQASYQKEPTVPIVSLMSKVSGRAVIGHPIKVQPLEYGSTDALIASTSDHCCSSETTVEHDRGSVLKPLWRTARRTNSRVPRPHLALMPGGDDQRRRVAFKKSGISNRTMMMMTPPERKKAGKKGSMSSSQKKTRMLSSIGLSKVAMHNSSGSSSSSSQMEGVMKGVTTVSCIPVKLVFSRLLEKINRPPSKAAVSRLVSVPESSSFGRMDTEEVQVQKTQEQ